MKKQERPVNKPEGMLWDIMTDAGWHVTKRGWPDFLCYKDGRLVCIEVKPKRGHRLKSEQLTIMLFLKDAGIECYRWTPGGFEPVNKVMDSVDDNPKTAHPTQQQLRIQRGSAVNRIKRQQGGIKKKLDIAL